MSQDQPFMWKRSLGGIESLGISRVGQTVLARLMESQINTALTCSVCVSVGEGLRKRTMVSVHLDARHFNFSQYATGAFQAATSVLELRGSKSE